MMSSPWAVSILLAGAVHSALLFSGGFTWVQRPDYGLQASSPSMEIYMVAAPEQNTPAEIRPEKADMTETAAQERPAESAKAGDGSSKQPGQSAVTFYSRASSETQGKAGKYQNAPPPYPVSAREKGWEGVVQVKAFVERDGMPSQVLVEKSSGYRVLDEAAVRAVKKWKFTSGRVAGMEISSWVMIPVRFQLKKS